MMEFSLSETGKVPYSSGHFFLEGYLLRWCLKYRFVSEFLLLGGQEYTVSREPLIILFRGMAILWQLKLKIMFVNKPVTIGKSGSSIKTFGN